MEDRKLDFHFLNKWDFWFLSLPNRRRIFSGKREFFYFHSPLPEKLFNFSWNKELSALNLVNRVNVFNLVSGSKTLSGCCFVLSVNDDSKIISQISEKGVIFTPKSHKKDNENFVHAVGG